MNKQIIDWEELNLEDIFEAPEDDGFDNNFINKYNDKVFKYYVLHSNFNLSALVLRKIANVAGVERIIPISRYRALVNFGRLFLIENVQKNINKEISKLVYDKGLEKKQAEDTADGVN